MPTFANEKPGSPKENGFGVDEKLLLAPNIVVCEVDILSAVPLTPIDLGDSISEEPSIYGINNYKFNHLH